ncbi:MAG: hypothetical protein LBG80_15980 [Bacteroidales bacterium]|jgi:hypothetical protein|nr:hypothetical protein [Bacteroidales bacterium]
MKKIFRTSAIVLLLAVGSLTVSAQNTEVPKTNFAKTEVETFDNNKFGWMTDDKYAKITKGYFALKAKSPKLNNSAKESFKRQFTFKNFEPEEGEINTSAELPLDPQKDFKITIKFQVVKFGGKTEFLTSLDNGVISLFIGQESWSVNNNNQVMCYGACTVKKKMKISLSIQKNEDNLFFIYNDNLLCTIKIEEISNSILDLQLKDTYHSHYDPEKEIRIDEIVVEQ